MCANSCHAREALRCAAAGMTVKEIMPRLKKVDANVYGLFVYSSTTVVRLAKWGRVPALGDGSDVQPGQYFTMGMRPGSSEGERSLPYKAKNFLALLNQAPADPGNDEGVIMKLLDREIAIIKDNLTPGQKLRDVFVGTPIRADMSVKLGEKLKSELPIEGEVTIIESLVTAMLCQYGEFMIFYWIE